MRVSGRALESGSVQGLVQAQGLKRPPDLAGRSGPEAQEAPEYLGDPEVLSDQLALSGRALPGALEARAGLRRSGLEGR